LSFAALDELNAPRARSARESLRTRQAAPYQCHNMQMSDSVHFDGDPSTDSARRHMERVLKSPERAPRWPWVLAALGSGGVWMLWRSGRAAARAREASPNESKKEGR
jgi:hypothetical protein